MSDPLQAGQSHWLYEVKLALIMQRTASMHQSDVHSQTCDDESGNDGARLDAMPLPPPASGFAPGILAAVASGRLLDAAHGFGGLGLHAAHAPAKYEERMRVLPASQHRKVPLAHPSRP